MTEHKTLIAALAAAQGEFPAITKDRKVDAGARKYLYADLAAVLAAVRPVLSRHGIALLQHIEPLEGDGLMLHTELRGYGEALESAFPIIAPLANPQAIGSFLTYARRYSLMALVGVAADDDDDDGHEAAKRPAPKTSRDQSRPPPDRMTRAALDTIETMARDMDAAQERPRIPPDEAWLAAARRKVEQASPDELRAWWNEDTQRRLRQDLHKRRADLEPAMDELKARVGKRWWECASLEIAPNGMGWQKWQGLLARTIDAAPTVAGLEKLLVDNAAHLHDLHAEVPKAHDALMAKADNARLLLADNEAPLDLHDNEEG